MLYVVGLGLSIDPQLLMCLLANSFATVTIVVILDWFRNKERQKELDWRQLELRRRLEQERRGWEAECEDLVQRVHELEESRLAYQARLVSQYRAQLCDHQGYIDKRIEGLRYDALAARLSETEKYGWNAHTGGPLRREASAGSRAHAGAAAAPAAPPPEVAEPTPSTAALPGEREGLPRMVGRHDDQQRLTMPLGCGSETSSEQPGWVLSDPPRRPLRRGPQ
eukprot:TRINITY_DN14237_c0_g1_i1.p1 TRINITY_DN14237_c0_g1~~TRINITY_DN14237_c0_g1_i1.p1  ORF type:complete len:253 (+),score=84.65 TRINITY_DN14237_c0_g1_i1:93-761(+)